MDNHTLIWLRCVLESATFEMASNAPNPKQDNRLDNWLDTVCKMAFVAVAFAVVAHFHPMPHRPTDWLGVYHALVSAAAVAVTLAAFVSVCNHIARTMLVLAVVLASTAAIIVTLVALFGGEASHRLLISLFANLNGMRG